MISKADVAAVLNKTDEWHAKRRHHIGSSEAKIIVSGDDAAVLRLWAEKRGEIAPENLSDVLPVAMGSWTEALNVYWFEKQTGMRITREGDHVVHPTIKFMATSLDGWIASENALLECKHVSGFESLETVVQRYQPQCHHAMSVTNADVCYLSIFSGTQKFDYIKIPFDPFYVDSLIEREAEFWGCVMSGKPPRALPPPDLPPIEAFRSVCMDENNQWCDAAHDWKTHKAAANTFNKAAKTLKDLVEPDVKTAWGVGITITRDKRGLSIKETP